MTNTIDRPYKKPGARTVYNGAGTFEPEVIGPHKTGPQGNESNMNDTSKRNFGKADPKPGSDANKIVNDIGFQGTNKKALKINKRD